MQVFGYLQPNFDLKISDSPLTRVAEFKYLDRCVADRKLSWSRHVEFISKTATKAVGVLFRKFYRHGSSKTLLRMFLAVVRPLLEYAAPVWDPRQLGLISTLERIQKLALRMCAKDWSASYEDLLIRFDLPTLKQRRKLLKLCFFYQVRSGSFFFPNAPVSASPMDPRLRNFNPSRLRGPTPHTLAYDSSFFCF